MERDTLASLRDPERLRALRDTGLLDSPPEDAFGRLARLASRILEAPVALLTFVDDRREFIKAETGAQAQLNGVRELGLQYSLCKHIVAGGAPLVLEDARESEHRASAAVTELGVIAYAGVPLIDSRDHALGALCVVDSKPRAWTGAEVETLRELAAIAVGEIELRVLARALRDSEQRLQQQSELLRAVLDNMGDGVVVADTAGKLIADNPAAHRIVGPDLAALSGLRPGPEAGLFLPDQVTPYPPDELPLARAIRGESTDQVEVFVRSAHRPDGAWSSATGRPLRGHGDELRGGIVVLRDVTEKKHAEQRLSRYADEVRAASLVDELTGLYNRRGFLALAVQQLKLATRNKWPVMVLFADLDGLKQVNDRFGHGAGDRVLVEVVQLLRQTFRESDVLARLGGDEFVVLTTDASLASVDLGARLQERLAALNAAPRAHPLSLSFGIAHRDLQQPESLDALLALADARMYEQKRAHHDLRASVG